MSTLQEGKWRNPAPTADTIIELAGRGIVLIERKFEPHGWAIPGGFIDYGESAEAAAVREAKEETSLDVELVEQFHTYSAPDRDPRKHTITVVFIAVAAPDAVPVAADDAADIAVVTEGSLPTPIAFDHAGVLADYFEYKRSGRRPETAQA